MTDFNTLVNSDDIEDKLKAVPTVMNVSDFLRDKYSHPLDFGLNLKGRILWDADGAGIVKDPYKLLEPIHDDFELDNLYLERGAIQDGGAAMVAYAKMQFTKMSDQERQNIIKALLRYCEMDTLAMVMIYEHWLSCRVQ